jgi:hypothetical protein
MRGALVRATKTITVILTFSALCGVRASGQVHERYEGWCETLRDTSLPDLVKFLNSVTPDEGNARCVTWAIYKLGKERYEPAIVPLVRLLDFRSPRTEADKTFRWLEGEFPAEDALIRIGKKALPEVLGAIKASTSSDTLRENAVFVWMDVYRQTDEHVKAVAVLKQEEMKAKDDKTRERLKWAVSKAITWCGPPEELACKQAAELGTP